MNARSTRVAVALLAAGAVVACGLGLPLIWDGGYQLAATLIEQRPFFHLTRFHSWLLWWPTVWLSRITENPLALLCAYGLPFLLAPAVSVVASWWFVRKSAPWLAVWALFGVAVSLPGQVFVINDSIWQQTLVWPIILGALAPLTLRQRLLWLTLAAMQFSHQIGAVLLGFAVLAAWTGGQRWARWAAGALWLLAVAKTAVVSTPALAGHLYDDYAAREATWERAWLCWQTGVQGFPLTAQLMLCGAAAFLVWGKTSAASRWLAGGASAILVLWAADPHQWSSALNYRRFAVPLAAPILIATLCDFRRGVCNRESRDQVAMILAAAFAGVVGIQAWIFNRELHALRARADSLSEVRVLTREHLPEIARTALDHWGSTATFMFLQGKTPRQFLAFDEPGRAAVFAQPAAFQLIPTIEYPAVPGAAGWFDHRPLLRALPSK